MNVRPATESALLAPSGAEAAHRHRVRMQLRAGAAFLAVAGLGWGGFFFARGYAWIVTLDVLMLLMAVAVIWLERRHRLRAASMLIVVGLLALLSWMALYLDAPSPSAPRSVHLFLLGLAVSSALLFAREPPWLRHGAPLLCLGAFVLLASSVTVLDSALVLPDSIRVGGTWANAILASLLVFTSLRILQVDIAERSGAEVDLRAALAGDQFELFYQPQVDVGGRVLGAEALLRWRHPRSGLVSPAAFIADAEANGCIHDIGRWVVQTACRQLATWRSDPALAHLRVSVNVSALEFRRDDYVETVLSAVAAAGAPAGRLKLELTETVLVDDLEDVTAKGLRLRAEGIGLSLDDFGTGYASLSYLRRLPLDQLKIDQSFVRDVLVDDGDATIARTLVGLGGSLGLEVIAEGVETEAQRRFLADTGCRLFQGYLFSRPLPVAAFEVYARAVEVAPSV